MPPAPPPPRLGNILSQDSKEHNGSRKRREARAAAQAKERGALLSQYPALRRRRESETWLLPQLIYHWAVAVVEQRAVQWEAGRGYWSRLTGYSITTTSQNYASLERDGLLARQARGPKGWNGWQTCILRPTPALMPAVFQQARKLRAEMERAARHARKKLKLSLTSGMRKDSGVSDNLGRKTPLREDSSPTSRLARQAQEWLLQIPLRAPPPKPTG